MKFLILFASLLFSVNSFAAATMFSWVHVKSDFGSQSKVLYKIKDLSDDHVIVDSYYITTKLDDKFSLQIEPARHYICIDKVISSPSLPPLVFPDCQTVKNSPTPITLHIDKNGITGTCTVSK